MQDKSWLIQLESRKFKDLSRNFNFKNYNVALQITRFPNFEYKIHTHFLTRGMIKLRVLIKKSRNLKM